MRRLALLAAFSAAFALPALAQYPGSDPVPDDVKPGFSSISTTQAQKYLTFLATQCEGRGSGQPGFQKAAEYVAARFKADGLKPMGDNGTYFQNVPFSRTTTENFKALDESGHPLAEGAIAIDSLGSFDVNAPVVVVRVSDPKAELSDSDVKALSGKIVILQAPPASRRLAVRSQILTSEAKALLVVADNVGPMRPRVSPMRSGARRGPAPALTGTAIGRIERDTVAHLGRTLDAALRYASNNTAVGAMLLDGKTTLHISGESKTEQVNVPNVVALLEGSDPTLKTEYVGVGGHLDHLGIQNGVVYPGADDDGSGSTAVMLVADAMVKNPKKPRRSILFMTFCGEELGLIGSSFLSDHPPVPLDKMVAELQMDMVARDSYGAQNGDPNRMDIESENKDTIRLVGSKRISTDLDKTIQEMNRHIGFKFKYDAEDVYTRSDHYNFAKKGIPIAFLFDGFTPDYHQPSDTVDKIDFPKLANAAKLYYLTAHAIADANEAPKHDVKQ